MIIKKQLAFFFLIYAGLRVFSFYFPPDTPLHSASIANSIATLAIILATSYLLLRRNIRGWHIVALEIISGGAGGFFAIGGVALRTWLLIASLTIFFAQKIKDRELKNLWRENKLFVTLFLFILSAVSFSAIRGCLAGHNPRLIIADAIPYLFLLYYFPFKKWFRQLAINAIIIAIVGNFLFIAITFIGFSSGIFALQDSYYHWFRDVALGKITGLPFHFYRLALDEHLLLIPALIYYLAKIIKREGSHLAIYLALLLLGILSVNLTRIYLLGMAIGLLVLFHKIYWKRWLTISALTGVLLISIFTTVHLAASRGQSLGWEFFGLRLQSIAYPQIEDSSLSRLLLLPKIIEKIKSHPLLGNGLGDTVTVYSPILKQKITTPHFDWGYLEIWAEMGLLGLLAWLALLLTLARSLLKKFGFGWQLASLVALLVINITSPAVFHLLGVGWLTILLAYTGSPKLATDDV